MPKKKTKASDVISALEKLGGLREFPSAPVIDASKLAGPVPAVDFFHDEVTVHSTDDFFSIMGGAPTPTGPLPLDPVSMIHGKDLPPEVAIALAHAFDSLPTDELDQGDLEAMGMKLPPGFMSLTEVFLHPTFVETCRAEYDTVWIVVPDGMRRVRVGVPDASVVDVPHAVPDGMDPDFYLKPDWYDDLKHLINRGEPVLIIGPAGVGKTEAVERIFKEREQRLEIVSCTPRTTANDLEGATDLVVEAGHQVTKFTPAAPAVACQEGYGLLLDEADAAPSEAMYSMYRILDGKPMHIVRKGYDGKVDIHHDFRCIGTQNTEGRGDDRGLYHGRAYQDEAFLDRWRNTIRVDYPKAEQEILILRKRTGISGPEGEDIVKTAEALRNALQKDEIMLTCTMRRTLAVATNIAAGLIPQKAWDLAVVNRATPEDGAKITAILQRIYGSKLKKKAAKKKKKKAKKKA
jgi:MoxR-like ATPase